eukprot:Nk52_evm1s497 gene=Nk52_evmTU1s497
MPPSSSSRPLPWEAFKQFSKQCLIVLPISITIVDSVCSIASVRGRSMEPTFNPNPNNTSSSSDRVLLNKWAIRRGGTVKDIRRGEIVVLWSPDDPRVAVVKRVLALEGDIVRTLDHYHIPKHRHVKIPKGHCWVEGDNPQNSKDSNRFGPVPLGLIAAKVNRIVWPPSRWQILSERVPEGRIIRPFDQKKGSNRGINRLGDEDYEKLDEELRRLEEKEDEENEIK